MRRLVARKSDSNLNSAGGGIGLSSSLSSDHLLPSNNSNNGSNGGSSSSLSSSPSPSRASIRKENNNDDDDAAAKSRHGYWWEQLRIRNSNHHHNNRLLLLLSSLFTRLKHVAHTNLLKFKHYLQTIDPVYAAIICIFIFVTLITLLVLETILLLGPRGSIIGGLFGRLLDQYIKDYTRYQTMSKWKYQLMNELQLSHVVYTADQNMDGAYLVDERWFPLGNTLSSRPNYAVVEMLLREKERRLRLGEMIYNSVVMAADDDASEEAVDNDVAGGCSLLPEVVLQLQTNDGQQQQQQTTKLLPYWLTNAIPKLNHYNGNGNGAIKTVTLDHSDIDPTSNLNDQLLQQIELYLSASSSKEKSATTSTSTKGGRRKPTVIPQSILNCPNFIRSKGKNNYYAIRTDPTLHCLGYFLGGIQLGDDDQILHQARSHITSILSTSSSLSSCQQSKIGYTVLSNKSTPSNQVRKTSSVWSEVSTILSAFPSNHPAYLCLPPLQPKSVGISPYNTANEELSFQSTFVNKLLTSYESKRRESREDSNHHHDNGESIIQGVATLSCEFHDFTTITNDGPNCCNQVSVTMFDSTDDGESIEKYVKNDNHKRGNQHHLVFTFVDNSEKEEKEQSALEKSSTHQQFSVSISERNQRFSSTKKKMHYKESIQKKMRRKSWGCEPGWWCNRCLQASMYGSFSKCSSLCGKCAPDFICNEREKETQIDVDVKVTGMNLSAADTMKRHHHQRIPRIIHQTYFEDLTKERFPQLVRLQNTWKAAGWEYRFYSDDTAREYIGENYPERFVSVFDALLPGAYKADFFRYLVLFKEGGIYADIDVMLDANLDQFITPDLAFFVPIDSVGGYADQNFCLWNGLIGSAPAHPVLANAIEWMVNLVSSRGDLYDMERAVCEVSGIDSMENWKIRAEPGLMLSGPCALGVAANRALGKDPLSKFVPDLTKQSSTVDAASRTRHLESDDAIGDVMIMVADKNDLGSFRFSDPERNIFFASTDMPGLGKAPLVYKEGGGGSIRSIKKKKKVRPHYSTCSHGDALWGTHDVYADNLVSPDKVKMHIRYE